MAWYDSAIFYHMYPLGMVGADKKNDGGEDVAHGDGLQRVGKKVDALWVEAEQIALTNHSEQPKQQKTTRQTAIKPFAPCSVAIFRQ